MDREHRHMDADGFDALVNAVVQRAARDYINALKRLRKNKGSDTAKEQVEELRKFFRSDYFTLLTDLDGGLLLEKLDREFESKNGGFDVKKTYFSHKKM